MKHLIRLPVYLFTIGAVIGGLFVLYKALGWWGFLALVFTIWAMVAVADIDQGRTHFDETQ